MLYLSGDWPRWSLMWLLATIIFFACKLLTWSSATSEHTPRWRQWAYFLAWPGMDAARFFAAAISHPPKRPGLNEWSAATLTATFGAIIFWNAQSWIAPSSPILLGWAGMIGSILILHFGSFQLLSCFWRSIGVDAPPLMNRPTHSTSIAEFWGRRWNTAFRDLTYQFLFRPLRYRCGPVTALVLGFVASGIVHDLVISIPAGGGYGGPTCFFCLQAAAILFERSSAGKGLGLGHGWRGWSFTGLVLLLPVRLLFHNPFVTRIVVPFMQACGAA